MSEILNDLKLSVRQLKRTPGFTSAAALVLAHQPGLVGANESSTPYWVRNAATV